VPYAVFAKVEQPQHGLFTVWHKGGRVALELRPDQFDKDFIETAVPINGLGGYFITSGQNDFQGARIVRVETEGACVSVRQRSCRASVKDLKSAVKFAYQTGTAATNASFTE